MSIAAIFSYTIIYTLCVHAHLCPTLCNSTDCSLPGFSVHGILQARILASAGEVAQSCPTVRFHGLKPTRLLHPWNFPGKSSGVGCHFLLQENFPTQGLNPGLLHCRQMLYHLSTRAVLVYMYSFKNIYVYNLLIYLLVAVPALPCGA